MVGDVLHWVASLVWGLLVYPAGALGFLCFVILGLICFVILGLICFVILGLICFVLLGVPLILGSYLWEYRSVRKASKASKDASSSS